LSSSSPATKIISRVVQLHSVAQLLKTTDAMVRELQSSQEPVERRLAHPVRQLY